MKRILGAVPAPEYSPMDGLWRELALRHDVWLWGHGRKGYERGTPIAKLLASAMEAPDLVLLGDPCRGDSEAWDTRGVTAPIVCVFTDTDRRFDRRVWWLSRVKPKMLLLRVKDDVGRFCEALPGLRVEWLPFGFDPSVFHEYGEEKRYDVGIFGLVRDDPVRGTGYPVRRLACELLAKEKDLAVGDFTSGTRDWPTGEEYARRINRCRIAIATGGMGRFVVQKYYEIPACGAVLLGAQVENGFDELFEVGKNALAFKPDCSDLVPQIRALLAEPDRLSWLARQGYVNVHARHTDAHRADDLERMLCWG